MSVRLEGIGAAGAAVSSAVGAILDWPILFGIAIALAAASTVSFFLSRRNRESDTRTAAGSQSQIKTGEKVAAGAAVISR